MTIAEARAAFEKEVEMAEIRLRVGEKKRKENQGAPTFANLPTTSGRANSSRGGRGGLSFN